MAKVRSKAIEKTVEVDRVIGHIKGQASEPTLVFMGGIHGNEPAGIFAMKNVYEAIKKKHLSVKGNIYFIAGNLQALHKGVRYLDEDLNRMWTTERVAELSTISENSLSAENAEQVAIYNLLSQILSTHPGPFYFFDIHTTSSKTSPFLTVNDSLLNRAFTTLYPLPIILGIEEYLEGPVLSYINDKGYVAFGFEAGQHDDPVAIKNAIAFCFLSMVFTQVMDAKEIDYKYFFDQLSEGNENIKGIFEITDRYSIMQDEEFIMLPGFKNFQSISKREPLALSNGTEIRAKKSGRIFMPLYQKKGSDGFYQIRRIHKSLLKLSAKMRKKKLDQLLVWLPGVSWMNEQKSGLIINKNIARFMAKQLMHLLGYRSIEHGTNYIHAFNREAHSKKYAYQKTDWINRPDVII